MDGKGLNVNDLISRQDFDKLLKDAEEEAIKKRKYVFASALNTIRGNLRDFPSVQPSDEYDRGWKEGRKALREETWEYVRDRFD